MDEITNIGLIQKAPVQVLEQTKYCLYARKSSEDDERQALSIDSQIKEMLEMATRDDMQIAEIRRESHSAKTSGLRPVYNQLIQDIRKGVFSGILTWAPDRLSRNAGDLGALVDLMDQGLLKEIRTHGQKFTNSPNEKFLLMILCSQAKLENDNRGVNVKRGQRARLEMGYRPCMAPLGYLNEKLVERGKSKVYVDPVRAPIIRELFRKIAYDYYSGYKLVHWAMYESGLTTRSGKRITKSGLYRILNSPYYYGEFEWPEGSGNWYKGTHEPLISKELFEKARGNLLDRGKYDPREPNKYAFTNLFKCGSCGSGVGVDGKIKTLKDGTMVHHIYYHCTQFRDPKCPELYIKEEDLIEQLILLTDLIDIDELGIDQQLRKDIEQFNVFASGMFGQQLLDKPLQQVDPKTYVKYILKNGSLEQKRNIMKCSKSKIIIKNKRLFIE
jgi:DNA invertase Pin-like site-specific DNA recombinase/predicted metal-binding protein